MYRQKQNKLQIPELENPAEAVLVGNAIGSSPPDKTQQKQRLQLFKLLAVSAVILYSYAKIIFGTEKENHIKRLNFHSVIKCHRITIRREVGIYLSNEHEKTFYVGLAQCGSVWACPICAAKIQERRAIEIRSMFEWAYKNKAHQVLMLTLTFPHKVSDELSETTKKHAEALEYFRSGKSYKNFRQKNEYVGMIKGTEITYGKNGWHLHTHDLYIVKYHLTEQEKLNIIKYINDRWLNCCIKAGLVDVNNADQVRSFKKHSINIIFQAKSSDYINKIQETQNWGADREIAKSNSKFAKKVGMTPFQILAKSEKKQQYKELFLEYVLCMKHKPQIFWSKGLKNLIGIDEKSDQELLEEQEDTAQLIVSIPARPHWRAVAMQNAQGELLNIAQTEGFAGVQEWFAEKNLVINPPVVFDKVICNNKTKFNFRLHWQVKDIEKPPPPPPPPPVTIDNDPLAW